MLHDQAMNPETVRGYLRRAFKDDLEAVESALGELTEAFSKEEIGSNAYRLYEHFRCPTAMHRSQRAHNI